MQRKHLDIIYVLKKRIMDYAIKEKSFVICFL